MLITFVVYAQECTTCSYGIVLLYNCVLTSAYVLPLPPHYPPIYRLQVPTIFRLYSVLLVVPFQFIIYSRGHSN